MGTKPSGRTLDLYIANDESPSQHVTVGLAKARPNKFLLSFSSDKDRRTDSRIRRKNTAQPRRESNPGSCEWDVCKESGPWQPRCCGASRFAGCTNLYGLFLVCLLLSASEAFLFFSGAVCWVFSNAYTKEEHLLVFSWLVIGEGP